MPRNSDRKEVIPQKNVLKLYNVYNKLDDKNMRAVVWHTYQILEWLGKTHILFESTTWTAK